MILLTNIKAEVYKSESIRPMNMTFFECMSLTVVSKLAEVFEILVIEIS